MWSTSRSRVLLANGKFSVSPNNYLHVSPINAIQIWEHNSKRFCLSSQCDYFINRSYPSIYIKMLWEHFVFQILNTCCSRLLAVANGWRTNCSQAQTLSSLLASSITGLVWMPNLFTVVAELSSTAFTSTCNFRTACTAKGNHSIP